MNIKQKDFTAELKLVKQKIKYFELEYELHRLQSIVTSYVFINYDRKTFSWTDAIEVLFIYSRKCMPNIFNMLSSEELEILSVFLTVCLLDDVVESKKREREFDKIEKNSDKEK